MAQQMAAAMMSGTFPGPFPQQNGGGQPILGAHQQNNNNVHELSPARQFAAGEGEMMRRRKESANGNNQAKANKRRRKSISPDINGGRIRLSKMEIFKFAIKTILKFPV
jgi:hypothetical protein